MMNLLSNQSTSSKKLVYSGFWLISIVLSLSLGFSFANIFSIQEISAKPPINESYVSNLKKRNLLFLNENIITKEIEKQFPKIEHVKIVKIFPNKLDISFEISHPSVQIKNNGFYLLVSSAGKILERKPTLMQNLRQVFYYQKIRSFESKPGEYLLDNDLLYALKLNEALNNTTLNINNLYIEKPGQIRLVGKDQQIYLNTKKRIDKNLNIVQNINKTFMIEGNPPKIVNLLFEKAIILP